MTELSLFLADEAATLAIGETIASALMTDSSQHHWVIYLQGNLGAGKTTLSRGILVALGHRGAVKSPTYTLVEPYDLPCDTANTKAGIKKVYHFDLYRLNDPQELEYLGVQDYFDHGFLCLIEWPERGLGLLPEADLIMTLAPQATGRSLIVQSGTVAGALWLKKFSLSAK